MKTITVSEAQHKMQEILDSFIELSAMYPDKPVQMYATVENMGFSDLISLYYKTVTPKKRLLMPEELDGEAMCMIYKPVPGCTIVFESEVCTKAFYSLNTSVKSEPFFNKYDYKRKFCFN